jgi:hypothetical protein
MPSFKPKYSLVMANITPWENSKLQTPLQGVVDDPDQGL